MNFKRILLSTALLVTSSVFATVNLTIDGREHSLPYCGGTVSGNNGGNDNQVNLVFRGVDKCKFYTNENGKKSELQGGSGNFHGSRTVTTAKQQRSGERSETVKIEARDGNPYEIIKVRFRVIRY